MLPENEEKYFTAVLIKLEEDRRREEEGRPPLPAAERRRRAPDAAGMGVLKPPSWLLSRSGGAAQHHAMPPPQHRLVMEKRLTNSDVNNQRCRLLIPNDFVSEKLFPMIDIADVTQIDNKGLEVVVWDAVGSEYLMKMKKWNNANYYVLAGKEWMQFVRRNELETGANVVLLWAFYLSCLDRKLCFGIDIVRIPPVH